MRCLHYGQVHWSKIGVKRRLCVRQDGEWVQLHGFVLWEKRLHGFGTPQAGPVSTGTYELSNKQLIFER